MGKAIAIFNQKGGVGKTTTNINLAACLANRGKKVLMVDIDPQGNTTSGIGIRKRTLKVTLYDALIDKNFDVKKAILPTNTENLFIIPASVDLAGAEVELAQMEGREFAYLCEANINEAYLEGCNRIGKLLEMLKPEIDSLAKSPRYFQIQILFSQDAMLMMDEMNAMHDFLDSYEDIEIKWSLNPVENETNYVKMQIITITE